MGYKAKENKPQKNKVKVFFDGHQKKLEWEKVKCPAKALVLIKIYFHKSFCPHLLLPKV
jgi:hypothetical protein